MKRVLVTFPNEHWLHRALMPVWAALLRDQRYEVSLRPPAAKPFENNLHHIVIDFLREKFDFWLSIDRDNPPICNPLDLVELDLDIVGLPTPVWHWRGGVRERPIHWNGYDYDPSVDAYREHVPREGLQRVDAIGTGCFMVARRVFEHPDLQKGAFTRKLYPDGRVNKGNDFSFCERARDAKFSVWCHYDYPCHHYQEIDLHDAAQAIKGLLTHKSSCPISDLVCECNAVVTTAGEAGERVAR